MGIESTIFKEKLYLYPSLTSWQNKKAEQSMEQEHLRVSMLKQQRKEIEEQQRKEMQEELREETQKQAKEEKLSRNKELKHGLKKALVVIMASSIISGCATTRYFSKREPARDYIRQESIEMPAIERAENKKSLEDIMGSLRNLESAISYKRNKSIYRERINGIMQSLRSKDYNAVQKKVRAFAAYLKTKRDKYSRKLLKAVKDFKYVRFEYLSEEYVEKTRLTLNPINYLVGLTALGAVIAISPFMLFADNPGKAAENAASKVGKFFVKKERDTIKNARYKKIEVSPYYGTERVIGYISTK